jgi:4-aminobutyrate aminotransferase
MITSDAINLLSPVWTHLTTLQPEDAEGIYLYDANGTAYIDFTSGIGVTNTGHCHPRIVKAIQEQAQKLIFGQMNIVISPAALKLVEALNDITPDEIDCFFLSNSGAEAVEGTVKLARQATGRRNVIVFQGSFHGRTAQTMAMTTAKTIYSYNYQPLPAGVYVAPYPSSYYYGWDEETTIDFCLKELNRLFRMQSAPENTAAIVIEPVLGEGGYIPVPAGFLQELRRICDEHGILLALDEIQSGFGRTGKMFAYEHANIIPDILIMAKGLGSGLPISAIGASQDLMSKWKPGSHGGTYGGGSAISLAAAYETIQVIRDEQLVENAAEVGAYFMERLCEIQSKYPIIGDVRGRGLMIATEFTRDNKADTDTAKAVAKACIEARLLLLTCGPEGNVIRWIPPLIVSKEQIDSALSIFVDALEKVLEP